MRLTVLTAILAGSALSAMAQNTPVGLWKTISDKDGSVTSEVRMVDNAGVVSGRIERTFRANVKPDAKCDLCKDDRKDQPIIGLEIIRGSEQITGRQDVWEGGTIVTPTTGRSTNSR